MIIVDHEYLAGRAQKEDDAARSANCIEGRIYHQNLANAYRRRCEDIFAATNHNAFRDACRFSNNDAPADCYQQHSRAHRKCVLSGYGLDDKAVQRRLQLERCAIEQF